MMLSLCITFFSLSTHLMAVFLLMAAAMLSHAGWKSAVEILFCAPTGRIRINDAKRVITYFLFIIVSSFCQCRVDKCDYASE
jgi:hypothetical protein